MVPQVNSKDVTKQGNKEINRWIIELTRTYVDIVGIIMVSKDKLIYFK